MYKWGPMLEAASPRALGAKGAERAVKRKRGVRQADFEERPSLSKCIRTGKVGERRITWSRVPSSGLSIISPLRRTSTEGAHAASKPIATAPLTPSISCCDCGTLLGWICVQ